MARAALEEVRAIDRAEGAGSAESRLKISLGVASAVPTPEATADDLVRNADQALYRAKTAGRARAVLHDDLEQRSPADPATAG